MHVCTRHVAFHFHRVFPVPSPNGQWWTGVHSACHNPQPTPHVHHAAPHTPHPTCTVHRATCNALHCIRHVSTGQALVSVADGHGPLVPGTLMSQASHMLLLPATAARYADLLTLLRANDHASVHGVMKEIFATCDDTLLNTDPQTSPHPRGGATFTLNHKVLDPASGNLYTIISNVGDSPCVKASKSIYCPLGNRESAREH